jgi:hypothetical protein
VTILLEYHPTAIQTAPHLIHTIQKLILHPHILIIAGLQGRIGQHILLRAVLGLLAGAELAHFVVALLQRQVDDLEVLHVVEAFGLHDVHDVGHYLLLRPDEDDAVGH